MPQINYFDIGKNFESNIGETVTQSSNITETTQGDILISQSNTTDINREHELKVLSTEESIDQAIDLLLQTSEDDMPYSDAQSPLENISYSEVDEETAIELASILKSYIEQYLDIVDVRNVTVEPDYNRRYYKIKVEWELIEDANISSDFVKFLSQS